MRVRAQGHFSLTHLNVRPETVGTFQTGRCEADRDRTAACSARRYSSHRVRSRSCPSPPLHHNIASAEGAGRSREGANAWGPFRTAMAFGLAGQMLAAFCRRWSSPCQSAFIRCPFPDRGV